MNACSSEKSINFSKKQMVFSVIVPSIASMSLAVSIASCIVVFVFFFILYNCILGLKCLGIIFAQFQHSEEQFTFFGCFSFYFLIFLLLAHRFISFCIFSTFCRCLFHSLFPWNWAPRIFGIYSKTLCSILQWNSIWRLFPFSFHLSRLP